MAIVSTGCAEAQDRVSAEIKADFVSHYIWRGQDLGDFAVQPTLGVGWRGLSLSAWEAQGLQILKTQKNLISRSGIRLEALMQASPTTGLIPRIPNILSINHTRHPMCLRQPSDMTLVRQLFHGSPILPETMESTRVGSEHIHHISKLLSRLSWEACRGLAPLGQCLTPPISIPMSTVFPW